MKLVPCYSPRAVFNKYTGFFVYARCGKCPACLDARAASWVSRLDLEMSCHKYTFFATFQYDEQHVPQVLRIDDTRFSCEISYFNSQTDEIFCLSDCDGVTPADIRYCQDTKVLPVHCISDFQIFIKRLRQYAVRKCCTNFRYFATAEYGPSTFRPHYHSLFFFDSPLLAEDFAELCCRFWTFGACYDPHVVDGSASSYVASYVNSASKLPAIYRHKSLRQKSVFSSRPPIGFCALERDTVDKSFFEPPYLLRTFQKGDFSDSPYWRSIEDRLFPRCPRFGLLSRSESYRVYSLSVRLPFIDDCVCQQIPLSGFYCRYLLSLKLPWYRDYFDLAFRDSDFNFNFSSLLCFVRQLITFHRNRLSLGFSLKEYVDKIYDYYDFKQISDLKESLSLQSVYFAHHPVRDYLSFYPNFVMQVNGKSFGSLRPELQFYLRQYGYVYGDSDIVRLSLSSAARSETVSLHDKIYYSNTKTKVNNDYLFANKDKFGNVINYYQNL